MHSHLALLIPALAAFASAVPAPLQERTTNITTRSGPNRMPLYSKRQVSDPAAAQVTNAEAFQNGAGNTDNANIFDGTGNGGSDVYNCYFGSFEGFPASDKWIEFDDMWNQGLDVMFNSCENNPSTAPGDTGEQAGQIWNAIQQVSQASLVDHRFILAVIMQESKGCVNIITTGNPDGIDNPGIMQSAGGVSFVGNGASLDAQQASINQMVIDGTQGTAFGDGLVQCINQYGDIYSAARCYNSGSVDESNLNFDDAGTSSYVMDIANRMTGWLLAEDNFDACIG